MKKLFMFALVAMTSKAAFASSDEMQRRILETISPLVGVHQLKGEEGCQYVKISTSSMSGHRTDMMSIEFYASESDLKYEDAELNQRYYLRDGLVNQNKLVFKRTGHGHEGITGWKNSVTIDNLLVTLDENGHIKKLVGSEKRRNYGLLYPIEFIFNRQTIECEKY